MTDPATVAQKQHDLNISYVEDPNSVFIILELEK
jgi:hypothetical protein